MVSIPHPVQQAINFSTPKLCECGCGQPAPLSPVNCRSRGLVKGEPLRFIHGHVGKLEKRTLEERFWSRVDKNGPIPAHRPELGPCWSWRGIPNKKGYGVVTLGKVAGKTPHELAHRLAWRLLRGPLPPGECVLHRCDNPPCVNPDHLFLGSIGDNNRDMVAKGRDVGNRKLTRQQIKDVCDRYLQGGITQRELAAQYGVTREAVRFHTKKVKRRMVG